MDDSSSKRHRKKAVLICISYGGKDDPWYLPSSHSHAEDMKKLITEVYNYEDGDIVVMIDGKGPAHLQPNEVNIRRELQSLEQGAQAGDRFLLYFSGHHHPRVLANEDEIGSEGIRTCDEACISGDDLRGYLVDHLPVGSCLVAIFDTCFSASILRLDHTDCHRVYTPWSLKPALWRRSDPKRDGNGIVRSFISLITTLNVAASVRKLALATASSMHVYRRVSTDTVKVEQQSIGIDRSRSVAVKRRSSSIQSVLFDTPSESRRTTCLKTETVYYDAQEWLEEKQLSTSEPLGPGESSFSSFDIPRCGSPEGFCSGFCPVSGEEPRVICISASKDQQQSWECDGQSMTTALIKVLRKSRFLSEILQPLTFTSTGEKPHPSFNDLLRKISYATYELSVQRHSTFRASRRELRESSEGRRALEAASALGMDRQDFQDPQVSSLIHINMETSFTL